MTSNHKSRHLLLVEDDATTAAYEVRKLAALGYSVDHVSSGEDALQLLLGDPSTEFGENPQEKSNPRAGNNTSTTPDLILMDFDLGEGIDGAETARTILERIDIPIVFFSAHTDPESMHRMEAISNYGFIARDTETNVLDGIIKGALRLFEAHERERNALFILRTSEAMANIGSWDWNVRTNEAYWSNQLYRIYGRNPSEGPPPIDSFMDHIHPEDRSGLESSIQKALSGENPYHAEYRIKRYDDGSTRHLVARGKVFFGMNSEPLRLIGSVQDITDHRKREQELEERNRFLETIFDRSLNAIVVADDAGYYTRANPAAADLFGYSQEDLCNMHVSHLKSPSNPSPGKQYEDFVQRGIETGDFEFIRPDGETRIAEYHAVRIAPDLNLSIMSDVTDRRHSEELLRRSLEEKSVLNREILHRSGNYFAMVSGMIELSIMESESAETRAALTGINSRLRALSELNSLLSTDSVKQGIRLDEYIEKITQALVPAGQRISVRIDCDAVTLQAKEATNAGIIVAELLTNAMKHAFPNNVDGAIAITMKQREQMVELKVQDDGVGTPTGHRRNGSMGLDLIHSLADRGNWHFEMESRNGTHCTLSIPLA